MAYDGEKRIKKNGAIASVSLEKENLPLSTKQQRNDFASLAHGN
jgi:hypothetical protein